MEKSSLLTLVAEMLRTSNFFSNFFFEIQGADSGAWNLMVQKFLKEKNIEKNIFREITQKRFTITYSLPLKR
jgi:citrate lyase alpha subunit